MTAQMRMGAVIRAPVTALVRIAAGSGTQA